MSDQEQYIRDLQIIVNKIMPIFAKPESGTFIFYSYFKIYFSAKLNI